MTVRETEVDGLPTLFAERTDGKVSGGLVFRVGWADENLAVRGLTHLVTHLVLSEVATRDAHHYTDLGATTTHFHVEGTGEQVAQLLSGVCSALFAPPFERLDVLKEIVRAESRVRPDEPHADALLRYGARGFGLAAYPEYGVTEIGSDLVDVWIAETFTKGNALLWLSGEDIPDGLRLPLPDGRYQPVPEAAEILDATPAWYAAESEIVRVTGLVPRSPAGRVFADLLGASARRDLRERDAVSHAATASYVARDAGTATVTLTADALPGRLDGVVGGLVDVLARLQWGDPVDAGLDEVRAAAADEAAAAAADHTTVAARAVDQLLGVAYRDPEQLAEDHRRVSADDVREAASAFRDSALAGLPGRGLDWAGWEAVQPTPTATVSGTQYPGRSGHAASLVVADDGVSTLSAAARSTVRFADLAVMASYGDGGRHLIGADGFRVHVEPSLFAVDHAVIERIDAAVDLARVVRLPGRRPEDLPGAVADDLPAAATSARPVHAPDGSDGDDPDGGPVRGVRRRWRSRKG